MTPAEIIAAGLPEWVREPETNEWLPVRRREDGIVLTAGIRCCTICPPGTLHMYRLYSMRKHAVGSDVILLGQCPSCGTIYWHAETPTRAEPSVARKVAAEAIEEIMQQERMDRLRVTVADIERFLYGPPRDDLHPAGSSYHVLGFSEVPQPVPWPAETPTPAADLPDRPKVEISVNRFGQVLSVATEGGAAVDIRPISERDGPDLFQETTIAAVLYPKGGLGLGDAARQFHERLYKRDETPVRDTPIEDLPAVLGVKADGEKPKTWRDEPPLL